MRYFGRAMKRPEKLGFSRFLFFNFSWVPSVGSMTWSDTAGHGQKGRSIPSSCRVHHLPIRLMDFGQSDKRVWIKLTDDPWYACSRRHKYFRKVRWAWTQVPPPSRVIKTPLSYRRAHEALRRRSFDVSCPEAGSRLCPCDVWWCQRLLFLVYAFMMYDVSCENHCSDPRVLPKHASKIQRINFVVVTMTLLACGLCILWSRALAVC